LLTPIQPWKVNEIQEKTSDLGSQTEIFRIYDNNFVLDHHDYVNLKMNTLLLTCKNAFYKNNIFAKWTNYREIFGPSILFKRIKSKRLISQPISNIFYNISESFNLGNFILPVNNIDHFISKKFVDISMRILLEGKIPESKIEIDNLKLSLCFKVKIHITVKIFINPKLTNEEITHFVFNKSGIIYNVLEIENFLRNDGKYFNFLIYDLEALGIDTNLVIFIRDCNLPSRKISEWKIEDFFDPFENKLFIELLSFSDLGNKFIT
jgi:hypothetical protein